MRFASAVSGMERAMTFDLLRLVRPNIRELKPYSSARSEFAGAAEVFLDANENAYGSPAGGDYNRYPDPLQVDLKQKASALIGISPSQMFVGNGSDEAIDLLFRIFCTPGEDAVIICPPTYGMYRVSAEINDVDVTEVRLTEDFQLHVSSIIAAISERTKLIFVCSPNNPTGNLMDRGAIIEIAKNFDGIVVVDEAYMDFADGPSMLSELGVIPNLVVLRTFSKAWGMAGLRVGMACASPEIIGLMNRVKPPYNVSEIAQRAVIDALDDGMIVRERIASIITGRQNMVAALAELAFVKTVYPSDANFVLVKLADANAVYRYLIDNKIVVRNRSTVELCDECLRITIGTPAENDRLIDALTRYEPQISGGEQLKG